MFFCFDFFSFSPGAHSFQSYIRLGSDGLNLDAAARTTTMSPPKNGRATSKHSGRSIEWFVKKRNEIPLGYVTFHKRQVHVPSRYETTSTALVSRPHLMIITKNKLLDNISHFCFIDKIVN